MLGRKNKLQFDTSHLIEKISRAKSALELLSKRYQLEASSGIDNKELFINAKKMADTAISLLDKSAKTLEISLPPRNKRVGEEYMKKLLSLIDEICDIIQGTELFVSKIERDILPRVEQFLSLSDNMTKI